MIKTNQALLDYLSRAENASRTDEAIGQMVVAKGRRLIRQGEAPQAVYCIEGGIVKCFITEENGRDYVLEFLGEGEMVGELEVLTASDNLTTIEALTDVTLFRLHPAFFRQQLRDDPVFNQLVMKELAIRLARTAKRAAFQQTYPIEYAVLRILYLFSDLKSTLSKQDLADYLAITVRSLNRILKQLREEKIIGASEHELVISPARLQQALNRFV